MSKASGRFLVLAGAAIFCAGLVMQSRLGTDGQAVRQSGDDSDLRPWAAQEWWRAESPSVAPSQPEAAEIATVVVTIPKRKETAATVPAAPAARSATPGDRASMARELQRELRRVGCYGGELNGDWTPETRRAMKAFMSRVNAAMPVEQPDPILLALVRGHGDRACGIACPAGQALADDGRCLPNAILAHAAKGGAARNATLSAASPSPASVATSWSTTTAAQPPHHLGDARASAAKPGEAHPNPPAAPPPAVVHRPTPRREAASQPERRQRASFGPEFLRRTDATGMY
jgi:peptidoglycan hydrolase-like protein with peptidoglycan-binding domain